MKVAPIEKVYDRKARRQWEERKGDKKPRVGDKKRHVSHPCSRLVDVVV